MKKKEKKTKRQKQKNVRFVVVIGVYWLTRLNVFLILSFLPLCCFVYLFFFFRLVEAATHTLRGFCCLVVSFVFHQLELCWTLASATMSQMKLKADTEIKQLALASHTTWPHDRLSALGSLMLTQTSAAGIGQRASGSGQQNTHSISVRSVFHFWNLKSVMLINWQRAGPQTWLSAMWIEF